MKKQLCVLVCLLLLMTAFSGCHKMEPQTETVDNIRISNLKTPEMNLTREEANFMDAVCSALRTAVFYRDNILCMTNVSDHELEVDLFCAAYDSEGNLVERGWLYAWEWEKDQLFRTKTGSFLEDGETLFLLARYSRNGIMYETNFIPVQISDEALHPNVSLKYEKELPCAISLMMDEGISAGYILLSYQMEHAYETTYILTLTMRKESGKDNYGDSCIVRIVDENGVVYSSATENYIYTKKGETIEVSMYVTMETGGNYTMQIY